MKQLLNTLYVTSQGAYLARDGETVAVRIESKTRLRVPIHTLDGIVCFGRISCSPQLMETCARAGVLISFLSEWGRFRARIQGPVSGNVLLRREQYRRADDEEWSAEIARAVVAAKVANCRVVLLRASRDRSEDDVARALSQAADSLSITLKRLLEPLPIDSVRGCEGEAARIYFGVFDGLITKQKDGFFFSCRNRRPPLDNMNALLSFLYALLAHDVASALESVGLDPAVGFLHRDRPGRPGLALDIMEEFRAPIADRLALSLVNRMQLSSSGFRATDSGAIAMDDDTRKIVLTAWQQRKQQEITHPYLDEKVAVGLLPFVQATLLARFLRHGLDAYPPLFWR